MHDLRAADAHIVLARVGYQLLRESVTHRVYNARAHTGVLLTLQVVDGMVSREALEYGVEYDGGDMDVLASTFDDLQLP